MKTSKAQHFWKHMVMKWIRTYFIISHCKAAARIVVYQQHFFRICVQMWTLRDDDVTVRFMKLIEIEKRRIYHSFVWEYFQRLQSPCHHKFALCTAKHYDWNGWHEWIAQRQSSLVIYVNVWYLKPFSLTPPGCRTNKIEEAIVGICVRVFVLGDECIAGSGTVYTFYIQYTVYNIRVLYTLWTNVQIWRTFRARLY